MNEKLIKYWIESSDRDFNVVQVLYNNQEYMHSLFFGHLVIEKLLKAMFSKVNKDNPHSPKIHDLLVLANKCNLELDHNKKIMLDTINSFNIEARYDDYKDEFRKRCTKEFTTKQIANIKELREWIKKLIAQ